MNDKGDREAVKFAKMKIVAGVICVGIALAIWVGTVELTEWIRPTPVNSAPCELYKCDKELYYPSICGD